MNIQQKRQAKSHRILFKVPALSTVRLSTRLWLIELLFSGFYFTRVGRVYGRVTVETLAAKFAVIYVVLLLHHLVPLL